jgi:hypothetical protein
MVLITHVAALGIALVLYALPHHVIPHGEASVGIVSTRGGTVTTVQASAPVETAQPAEAAPEGAAVEASSVENAATVAEATATPEPTATPAPVVVGNFKDTYADMFTGGEVNYSDTSYQSGNVAVRYYTEYNEDVHSQVYLVEFYVADISCLITAFGKDTYGRGYTEWIEKIADRYTAVTTLNGDYYGTRDTGVVIRNGTLYRNNKTTDDIAILYWDGHMEMFKATEFDAMKEMERGAYQSWCFGPSLLDGNGMLREDYPDGHGLNKRHPRSAIGYYEPGHYCFVAVDGRNKNSRGATIPQLATIMAGFGCKLAYNLDGGQTSLLALGPKLVNVPSDGGRPSSDYIMVVDRITE